QPRGAAGFLPGPAVRGQAGRGGHAVLGEQRLAADDDCTAVDGPARPEPGQRPEIARFRQRPGFASRGRADRRGHRVLDACSTAPAYLSTSARLASPQVSTPARDIRPVVTVPVLSSTTTRTDRDDSRAW